MANITYGLSAHAWAGYEEALRRLIEEKRVNKICEVGGGANPSLPIEYISSHNLDYTVFDISEEELKKTPPGYKTKVADICAKNLDFNEKFDLVFSKMLAEHLADGETFHRNVYNMLNEGGLAFHFFPTLYTIPFIVNKITPRSVSSALLDIFAPRDRVRFVKVPAYYNWCRGPTNRQIRRFETLNYNVLEYRGFFGLEGYYRKIPFMKYVDATATNFLIRHPLPYLTAYAYVLLKK